MAKNWRQELGKWGETTAASYLINQGLEILKRNYRCEYGEIDLIAKEDETIVFVEVKTRSSSTYGLPEEAVDAAKQEHIVASAENYLMENSFNEDWRVDVISIIGQPKDQEAEELVWFKNALE